MAVITCSECCSEIPAEAFKCKFCGKLTPKGLERSEKEYQERRVRWEKQDRERANRLDQGRAGPKKLAWGLVSQSDSDFEGPRMTWKGIIFFCLPLAVLFAYLTEGCPG